MPFAATLLCFVAYSLLSRSVYDIVLPLDSRFGIEPVFACVSASTRCYAAETSAERFLAPVLSIANDALGTPVFVVNILAPLCVPSYPAPGHREFARIGNDKVTLRSERGLRGQYRNRRPSGSVTHTFRRHAYYQRHLILRAITIIVYGPSPLSVYSTYLRKSKACLSASISERSTTTMSALSGHHHSLSCQALSAT